MLPYYYEKKMMVNLKMRLITGVIIALIAYAITLITNTSPTPPKEDTTTKTLTNTISNK